MTIRKKGKGEKRNILFGSRAKGNTAERKGEIRRRLVEQKMSKWTVNTSSKNNHKKCEATLELGSLILQSGRPWRVTLELWKFAIEQ